MHACLGRVFLGFSSASAARPFDAAPQFDQAQARFRPAQRRLRSAASTRPQETPLPLPAPLSSLFRSGFASASTSTLPRLPLLLPLASSPHPQLLPLRVLPQARIQLDILGLDDRCRGSRDLLRFVQTDVEISTRSSTDAAARASTSSIPFVSQCLGLSSGNALEST